MKKFAFLSTFFFIGSVMAGIITDINNQYVQENPNLDVPDAPRLRMEYIITNANNILDSFTLMKDVNAEISATNQLVHEAMELQWRAEHPNQKFNVSLYVVATNYEDGITVWTNWLNENPTNGNCTVTFRTNVNKRVVNKDITPHVSVHTNWIFTAKEKREYQRLQREYNRNKYSVIGHLSEEDRITYTNQTAQASEINRDLKLIIDSCNFMKNYASITNNEYQAKIKREKEAAKKAAEEAAKNLTTEQEERYYEIIDRMEELGISNEDDDIGLLKSNRKMLRSKGKLLKASSTNETASLSDKLRYIKSLSKEDQRIFKIGNKKLRTKESLKTELSMTEWDRFNELQIQANVCTNYTQKVEFMSNLSDEDRLIYKSGRRIKLDAKIEAKKRFHDPNREKEAAKAKWLKEYKARKGIKDEDAKTMNRIRRASRPVNND